MFLKGFFPGASKGVIVWEWVKKLFKIWSIYIRICMNNHAFYDKFECIVGSIVGTKENSGCQHFLFFPIIFSTLFPNLSEIRIIICVTSKLSSANSFNLEKSKCWSYVLVNQSFLFKWSRLTLFLIEKVLVLVKLTLSQTIPGFYVSVVQAFWKHCGKRRNCSLQAISPFPTVFSTRFKNFLTFSSNLKLSSANSLSFEKSKICRLGKG